jgi:hypothetical protein
MREFFNNYLQGLVVMFVVILFLFSILGPMLLAAIISPWFGLGYFVTIPLGCVCLDYFMKNMD